MAVCRIQRSRPFWISNAISFKLDMMAIVHVRAAPFPNNFMALYPGLFPSIHEATACLASFSVRVRNGKITRSSV